MTRPMSSHDSLALLEDTFPDFPPASLPVARRRLEELRCREIRVMVSAPGGLTLPTGLWAVLGPDVDLVWADATLSPSHQLVTICHEFAPLEAALRR